MKGTGDKQEPKERAPRSLRAVKPNKFKPSSAAAFESSKTDFGEDDDDAPR
jgi:hypothetical protein